MISWWIPYALKGRSARARTRTTWTRGRVTRSPCCFMRPMAWASKPDWATTIAPFRRRTLTRRWYQVRISLEKVPIVLLRQVQCGQTPPWLGLRAGSDADRGQRLHEAKGKMKFYNL